MMLEDTDVCYLERAIELIEKLAMIRRDFTGDSGMAETVKLLTQKVHGFVKQLKNFDE